MSRLLQRISTEMKDTLTYGDLIVIYATILHEEGKLYHFDDEPSDIGCFSSAEVFIVRLWTNRLYCGKLFSIALTLNDPNYEKGD